MPRPETCSVCGQEVRFGARQPSDNPSWLHREPVDHQTILGQRFTPAAQFSAEMEYLHREFIDADGKPYTAALYDIRKDKDVERRKRRLAEYHGQDPDYVEPLPPIEIHATPVEPDTFAPRSGLRQVVNLVEKTPGWERYRLTHARGPYLGANGESLGVSDTIVLGAREDVGLDGSRRFAVASWRDGKFDHAYIGVLKDGRLDPLDRADATTMKNWIKGKREANPSEGDDRPGLSVPGLDSGS